MNFCRLITLFALFLVVNNASAQYVEIGKSIEDSINTDKYDWEENWYVIELIRSTVSKSCLKFVNTDEEEYNETGIRSKLYLDTTCTSLDNIKKIKIDICGNSSDRMYDCYDNYQPTKIFTYLKKLDTFNIHFGVFNELEQGPQVNSILKSLKIPSSVKVVLHTADQMPAMRKFETSYLFGLPNLKYVSYKDLLTRFQIRTYPDPHTIDSLPEGITKLEMVYSNFGNIPILPSTIDTLIINRNYTFTTVSTIGDDYEFTPNSFIKSIPNIPSNLKYLELSDTEINSLPTLPTTLEHMDVGNNALTVLPVLPNRIKYLNIGNPNPIKILTGFDENGEYVYDTIKNVMKNLNNLVLPTELITFKMADLKAENMPQNLPATLQYLDANKNLIQTLPILSSDLKEVDVSFNLLSSLPALPASLRKLNVSFNNYSLLPTLPENLKVLNFSSNKISTIPTLPTGLISLKAGNNIFKIVPKLPDYLTELWLDNSDSITTLPTLPRKLSLLDLSNCKRLTCLPVFPKTLKTYTAPTSVGCIPNYTDYIKTGTICNVSRICNTDDYARLGGIVFVDINSNGVFNTGIDKPIKNLIIKNERTEYSFYSVTNADGFYQILVDTAVENEILFPEYSVHYTTLSPLKYVVNPTFASYLGDTFDFKLVPIPNVKDLEITVTNGGNVARPGFTHDVYLQYNNLGTTPAQGTVKFNYPENWEIIESLPAYSQQSGDTLYWDNMNMGAFSEMNTIKISLRVPVETPLGLPYSYTGIITPLEGDANTENNFSILNSETVGSFDPNDKLVHPEVLLPGYSDSTELTYTIRFQNTGTYYAENVLILDTLTSDIDPASIKVISSSHDYEFNILGNGILEFWFEDIMLPDSNENEFASHGHIIFTARPKSGIAEGQKIINNAGIYFDYNKPIITDYATTSVRVATSVQLNEDVNALVYPNPAQHTVNVRLSNKEIDASISLYDIQGSKISERKLDAGLASFDVQNLPQGMYLIVIQNQDVYKSVKFLITH